MSPTLRMGRINFLNVLPIYHPLEAGIIPHDFELVSGPPALLNNMMAAGELHVSSCSCIEYARHPGQYYLVRDLSIGSNGPVMSVLLLSPQTAAGSAGPGNPHQRRKPYIRSAPAPAYARFLWR